MNDDATTRSQFNPYVALDRTSGTVAVGFHDSRNDNGTVGIGGTNTIPNDDAEYWATYTTNGGASFAPNARLSGGWSNAAAAGASTDYGDYEGQSAQNGKFYAVWADNANCDGLNPNGTAHQFDLVMGTLTIPGAAHDADGDRDADIYTDRHFYSDTDGNTNAFDQRNRYLWKYDRCSEPAGSLERDVDRKRFASSHDRHEFPKRFIYFDGFWRRLITVTPGKTAGQNGITSFDAARIAQHVTGTSLLTGNQLIVADVSSNGAISSFDAAETARYAAAVTGFGATGNWIFSPANHLYPSVNGAITGEDYSALLMGEVSGNWSDTGARRKAKAVTVMVRKTSQ